MAYTKTTWVEGSEPAITAEKLNNIESGIVENETNIGKVETDSRTPSQTATPTASGKLSDILSFIATLIKSITGKANWYDVPTKSLDDKLDKSGGTMTGILAAQSNTSYTTKQVRNIILSTSDAVLSSMADGDIWIKYE